MARRRKAAPRPLAEDSRARGNRFAQEPPRRRRRSRLRGLWVPALMAGLLYLFFNAVPAGDRQEIVEYITEQLGGAQTAPPGEVTATAAVPVSVPDAVGAELPLPTEVSADAPAQPAARASSGGGLGGFLATLLGGGSGPGRASTSSSQITIQKLPLAYNAWLRTDYVTAEAAVLAMQTMDRQLGTGPTELTPLDEVRARVAAIYRAGSQSLLIFVEATTPPPVAVETVAPKPATLRQRPVEVAAQVDVVPVAEDETAQDGPVEVVLADIAFTDFSEGRRGVMDLRTTTPEGLTLILRGRVSVAAAEEIMETFEIRGFR